MAEQGEGQTESGPRRLKRQWLELATQLNPQVDTAKAHRVFQDVATRYSEASRGYHTLQHVSEMLALTAKYKDKMADPNAVRAATWFHDVVYNSRANDNEEQSAELAKKSLTELGAAPETVDKVASYILATKAHELPAGSEKDLALFIDFDMAILAADPKRYAEYVEGVEKEYGWAKDVDGKDLYTPGRLGFLQGAVGKPVFHSEEMKPLEPQARTNMQWEITKLQEAPK